MVWRRGRVRGEERRVKMMGEVRRRGRGGDEER